MSYYRLTSYFPIIIGFLLWIVPVLHPVSACGADGNARKPAAVDTAPAEWEGKESAVGEPLDIVVTDGGEWRRLWRRAFDKDAPEMDFDRFFVACVFLGHRAGWWYSISLGDPAVKGEALEVGYGLVMLKVDAPPSVFKNPGFRGQYRMKAFPKRGGLKPVLRMEFKEGEFMPVEREFSR
jgi:hypothetical protein